MSIKIEIPGDFLEIFFVANGECMWKYGRILQFLVANATILVTMYSVAYQRKLSPGALGLTICIDALQFFKKEVFIIGELCVTNMGCFNAA